MTTGLRRRTLLQAALGAGSGLAGPAARACDFFAPNLRISHIWTRATAGAPFAVVCMSFEEVAEDDRLVGIETPVAAGGEIGGRAANPAIESTGRPLDFFIPRGRTTVLDEAGPHLRLTGLRQPLLFGASYPLTLIFERDGRVPADIDVDFGPLPGRIG